MKKQEIYTNNITILLLAAGASQRMGMPKQLISWHDHSIIEHQLKTVLSTNCKIHLVLGAYAQQIKPIIEHLPIQISIYENWKKGMGNSLAYGLKEILHHAPETKAVLVALVDQPLLEQKHYLNIIETFTPHQKQIICSQSNTGWSGPPVLFDTFYFDELMQLDGDNGAKSLTKKYRDSIHFIQQGTVLEDIDTPQALERMRKS